MKLKSSGILCTNEIINNSALRHKNILKFIGISFSSANEVLLLTEYMEQKSLKDVLTAHLEQPMDWKLKIRLAIDVTRGMIYLHTRDPPIIHRDLKTSNLLVQSFFGNITIRSIRNGDCRLQILVLVE